jgi:acyl-[acyl-carrier-protein] desaturase
VDGEALLERLAPTVERLLDRHRAAAREWFPHALVPWDRAGAPAADDAALPEAVRAALVLNILTEDALPYYTTGLFLRFGTEAPWADWIRHWTAEEMRHGSALHDYVSVTGALDPVELERRRFRYVASASIPTAPSVADACVYLAVQELATRIAHANTARLLRDPAGRRLVAQVAADEHLHHLFYRDLVTAALDVSPAATVVAIDRQLRHFVMPGHEIEGFAALSRSVSEAGIYSTAVYLEHVVVPLVGAWGVAERALPPGPAQRARTRLLAFVDRLQSIAPRLARFTSAAPVADATPGGSW